MSPENNPVTKVTVRQVAERAGVHYTTVSLALRNSPRLLQETRTKIQELAREMGYQPDPMLAALNAYRLAKGTPHYKATFAWINNWPVREQLLGNREFNEYYQGASSRARELGYTVEEFWLHEKGMTPAKLHRILKARNIQGLLVAPQPFSHVNPEIDFDRFSAVTFGYSMQPSVLHVITNHHFHTLSLALTKIYELGYRKVALAASSDWDRKVGHSWLAGLQVARWKYPSMKLFAPFLTKKRPESTIRDWIVETGADVIVSFTKVIHQIRELGYAIPEDIGFVSLNLSLDDMTVSGMYQNDLLIGKKAVDVLVGMLHRGERGIPETAVSTLVEGVWRDGTTVLAQP